MPQISLKLPVTRRWDVSQISKRRNSSNAQLHKARTFEMRHACALGSLVRSVIVRVLILEHLGLSAHSSDAFQSKRCLHLRQGLSIISLLSTHLNAEATMLSCTSSIFPISCNRSKFAQQRLTKIIITHGRIYKKRPGSTRKDATPMRSANCLLKPNRLKPYRCPTHYTCAKRGFC